MWKLSIAVFSVVYVALSGASLHAQRSGLTVRVDGVELASGRLLSIVIDGDTDNPDAAVVVLIPDAAPAHFFGRGLDLATIDGENVVQRRDHGGCGHSRSIRPLDRHNPGAERPTPASSSPKSAFWRRPWRESNLPRVSSAQSSRRSAGAIGFTPVANAPSRARASDSALYGLSSSGNSSSSMPA